ncbi:MAG: nitrous oxide reductase accessory protein NosL [Armatimonadetes bacterium]|nr:nitrous oxide reductase accessory protein NosL [Armatimonadota bacterium]
MKARWLVLLALTTAFLNAGCARQDPTATPPQVRYGQDPCTECSMIINESRYASALVTADGQTLLFDDLGELGAHARKLDKPPLMVWVRDYSRPKEEAWLKGSQAVFVQSPQLKTPMGYGFVAVASESEAKNLAVETKGRVLRLKEILSAEEQLR